MLVAGLCVIYDRRRTRVYVLDVLPVKLSWWVPRTGRHRRRFIQRTRRSQVVKAKSFFFLSFPFLSLFSSLIRFLFSSTCLLLFFLCSLGPFSVDSLAREKNSPPPRKVSFQWHTKFPSFKKKKISIKKKQGCWTLISFLAVSSIRIKRHKAISLFCSTFSSWASEKCFPTGRVAQLGWTFSQPSVQQQLYLDVHLLFWFP